jgi:hypothetical protein
MNRFYSNPAMDEKFDDHFDVPDNPKEMMNSSKLSLSTSILPSIPTNQQLDSPLHPSNSIKTNLIAPPPTYLTPIEPGTYYQLYKFITNWDLPSVSIFLHEFNGQYDLQNPFPLALFHNSPDELTQTDPTCNIDSICIAQTEITYSTITPILAAINLTPTTSEQIEIQKQLCNLLILFGSNLYYQYVPAQFSINTNPPLSQYHPLLSKSYGKVYSALIECILHHKFSLLYHFITTYGLILPVLPLSMLLTDPTQHIVQDDHDDHDDNNNNNTTIKLPPTSHSYIHHSLFHLLIEQFIRLAIDHGPDYSQTVRCFALIQVWLSLSSLPQTKLIKVFPSTFEVDRATSNPPNYFDYLEPGSISQGMNNLFDQEFVLTPSLQQKVRNFLFKQAMTTDHDDNDDVDSKDESLFEGDEESPIKNKKGKATNTKGKKSTKQAKTTKQAQTKKPTTSTHPSDEHHRHISRNTRNYFSKLLEIDLDDAFPQLDELGPRLKTKVKYDLRSLRGPPTPSTEAATQTRTTHQQHHEDSNKHKSAPRQSKRIQAAAAAAKSHPKRQLASNKKNTNKDVPHDDELISENEQAKNEKPFLTQSLFDNVYKEIPKLDTLPKIDSFLKTTVSTRTLLLTLFHIDLALISNPTSPMTFNNEMHPFIYYTQHTPCPDEREDPIMDCKDDCLEHRSSKLPPAAKILRNMFASMAIQATPVSPLYHFVCFCVKPATQHEKTLWSYLLSQRLTPLPHLIEKGGFYITNYKREDLSDTVEEYERNSKKIIAPMGNIEHDPHNETLLIRFSTTKSFLLTKSNHLISYQLHLDPFMTQLEFDNMIRHYINVPPNYNPTLFSLDDYINEEADLMKTPKASDTHGEHKPKTILTRTQLVKLFFLFDCQGFPTTGSIFAQVISLRRYDLLNYLLMTWGIFLLQIYSSPRGVFNVVNSIVYTNYKSSPTTTPLFHMVNGVKTLGELKDYLVQWHREVYPHSPPLQHAFIEKVTAGHIPPSQLLFIPNGIYLNQTAIRHASETTLTSAIFDRDGNNDNNRNGDDEKKPINIDEDIVDTGAVIMKDFSQYVTIPVESTIYRKNRLQKEAANNDLVNTISDLFIPIEYLIVNAFIHHEIGYNLMISLLNTSLKVRDRRLVSLTHEPFVFFDSIRNQYIQSCLKSSLGGGLLDRNDETSSTSTPPIVTTTTTSDDGDHEGDDDHHEDNKEYRERNTWSKKVFSPPAFKSSKQNQPKSGYSLRPDSSTTITDSRKSEMLTLSSSSLSPLGQEDDGKSTDEALFKIDKTITMTTKTTTTTFSSPHANVTAQPFISSFGQQRTIFGNLFDEGRFPKDSFFTQSNNIHHQMGILNSSALQNNITDVIANPHTISPFIVHGNQNFTGVEVEVVGDNDPSVIQHHGDDKQVETDQSGDIHQRDDNTTLDQNENNNNHPTRIQSSITPATPYPFNSSQNTRSSNNNNTTSTPKRKMSIQSYGLSYSNPNLLYLAQNLPPLDDSIAQTLSRFGSSINISGVPTPSFISHPLQHVLNLLLFAQCRSDLYLTSILSKLYPFWIEIQKHLRQIAIWGAIRDFLHSCAHPTHPSFSTISYDHGHILDNDDDDDDVDQGYKYEQDLDSNLHKTTQSPPLGLSKNNYILIMNNALKLFSKYSTSGNIPLHHDHNKENDHNVETKPEDISFFGQLYSPPAMLTVPIRLFPSPALTPNFSATVIESSYKKLIMEQLEHSFGEIWSKSLQVNPQYLTKSHRFNPKVLPSMSPLNSPLEAVGDISKICERFIKLIHRYYANNKMNSTRAKCIEVMMLSSLSTFLNRHYVDRDEVESSDYFDTSAPSTTYTTILNRLHHLLITDTCHVHPALTAEEMNVVKFEPQSPTASIKANNEIIASLLRQYNIRNQIEDIKTKISTFSLVPAPFHHENLPGILPTDPDQRLIIPLLSHVMPSSLSTSLITLLNAVICEDPLGDVL